MRTDDLVHAMVVDHTAAQSSLGRQFALAIAIDCDFRGLVLVTLARSAAAALTVRFDLKIVETLLLAATAVALVLRLAQPAPAQVCRRSCWRRRGSADRRCHGRIAYSSHRPVAGQTRGQQFLVCLTAIPLLSLLPLAALLLALRHGAPTARRGGGGLIAGGLAAALYAMHCIDDSPLFVATWYTIAIGAMTVLGAFLGRLLLRW